MSELAALLEELEVEVRPLVTLGACDGGYDCCGCLSPELVLDHVEKIIESRIDR